jgi:hypothetical protein
VNLFAFQVFTNLFILANKLLGAMFKHRLSFQLVQALLLLLVSLLLRRVKFIG